MYEDAAIDQAVEGVVNGIFFNQGHVCCAGSRLLLQESIHDEFIKKLEKRMQSLRVGNPLDKNTDIGAINSKEQLDKITGLVNEGVEDGGELFQTECELPGNGFWFRPTLFTNVQPSYSIAREEIFGPVLTTLTFRTPEEAVEIANNTEYGLSAVYGLKRGLKYCGLLIGLMLVLFGRIHSTSLTLRLHLGDTKNQDSEEKAEDTAFFHI